MQTIHETFKTILHLNDKNNSCLINGKATFNDKQLLEIKLQLETNKLQLTISLRTTEKSTNHEADLFLHSFKTFKVNKVTNHLQNLFRSILDLRSKDLLKLKTKQKTSSEIFRLKIFA
jgi:succinate dehydrogenase flavin-adding protein (antitoxin of CptAB toxin-antitoxin module)